MLRSSLLKGFPEPFHLFSRKPFAYPLLPGTSFLKRSRHLFSQLLLLGGSLLKGLANPDCASLLRPFEDILRFLRLDSLAFVFGNRVPVVGIVVVIAVVVVALIVVLPMIVVVALVVVVVLIVLVVVLIVKAAVARLHFCRFGTDLQCPWPSRQQGQAISIYLFLEGLGFRV